MKKLFALWVFIAWHLYCSHLPAYDTITDCVFTFSPGWYVTANSDHATHWQVFVEGTKRFEVPAFQTEGNYRTCWPTEFKDFYENKMYPEYCPSAHSYCNPTGILAFQLERLLLPAGVHTLMVRPMNYVITGDEAEFSLFVNTDGSMSMLKSPDKLRLVVIQVKENKA